jgi:hypothetical protein
MRPYGDSLLGYDDDGWDETGSPTVGTRD